MMTEKKNIIMIGMPGSGKSTVGVVLAKTLGYDFVDTDLLISKQQKDTLQHILDREGLDYFLKCEEQAGLSVDCNRTIVATGGSMVFSEAAMAHLKSIGKVVYLDVALEELEKRLTNIKTRGIAAKPGKTIGDIYRERTPFYEKYADVTVQVPSGVHLEAVVEDLITALIFE